MKKCPKCGTAYTDETLRYCLADGAVLAGNDEQETVLQVPAVETAGYERGGQVRVEIPSVTRLSSGQQPAPVPPAGPSWLKIIFVVGLFGALIAIGIVGAAALIYFNKDTRTAESSSNTNQNTRPAPSPATGNETDKLREQIANLEKRLNEQKNSNRPTANSTTTADQPTLTSSTARVNSPGDGFLALRSFPNSEAGERVTQIPHGATVNISGCLPKTKIGSKTGRWCRANYNSYSGWVFDAWLIY